jgi:addiction module HigA family antidote
MPVVPRKGVTRSPRKVTLPKLRASEILSGLNITPSERQHAKRAVAAAKKAMAVKTRASRSSAFATVKRDLLPPVHPGEVLLEEFLKPMSITQYRLAKDISVPPRRINEIVLNKRGITADTALRLARYFGTSEQFWLNLQNEYDLDVERERLGDRLDSEIAELHVSAMRR